jgi:transposase
VGVTVEEVESIIRMRDEASAVAAKVSSSYDKLDASTKTLASSTTKLSDAYAAAKFEKSTTELDAMFNRMQVGQTDIDNVIKKSGEASAGFGVMGKAAAELGGYLAAAFTVERIGEFAVNLVDTGDHLNDLHEKTKLSVEGLQALDQIAKQNGTSLDALARAGQQLGVRLANGDNSTKQAVKDLGLAFADLRNATPEERLSNVMTSLGGMDDVAKRDAVGMQLLGRSFLEVSGAANEGFSAAFDAAKKTGVAITGEQAKTLAEVKKFWNDLVRVSEVGGADIVVGVVNATKMPNDWFGKAIGIDKVEATFDQIEADMAKVAASREELQAALVDPAAKGVAAWTALRDTIAVGYQQYRALSDATKANMSDMLAWGASAKDVADAFGVTVAAVERLIERQKLQADQDKVNLQLTKQRADEEKRLNEEHAKQIKAIQDQLSGQDKIAKAQQDLEAIEKGKIDVTHLSADATKQLTDDMLAGEDALIATGHASDQLTSDLDAMRLKALEAARDASAAFAQIQAASAAAAAFQAQNAAIAAAQNQLLGSNQSGISVIGAAPEMPGQGSGPAPTPSATIVAPDMSRLLNDVPKLAGGGDVTAQRSRSSARRARNACSRSGPPAAWAGT